MLLKMKRTQKTRIGRLLKGVAYDFDESDSIKAGVAKDLLARGMAQRTTAKQIDKDAKDAAAREKARIRGDGYSPTSALDERLAVLEAEAAERREREEAEAAEKARQEAEAAAQKGAGA